MHGRCSSSHAAIHALDATLRSLAADEQKALVRFLRHLEVLDREQATPENVEDLVVRATHLTKAKAKELAVSIQPREVPADGLRRLRRRRRRRGSARPCRSRCAAPS